MAYNNIHTSRFEYDGFSVLPPYYMTHIALGSPFYFSMTIFIIELFVVVLLLTTSFVVLDLTDGLIEV